VFDAIIFQPPPFRTVRSVLVSGGRELPPPDLAGRDVKPSLHPAPTGRLAVRGSMCQWANSPGWCRRTASSQAHARVGWFRSRLNFCLAQRTRCSLMRTAREHNSER
jgi:hypothetical protein